MTLPRSLRALKGWRKLCPSLSRKPWAWAVWCAMAMQLSAMGEVRMAIGVLLAVHCYLRPKELLGLRCGSLMAPTRQGVQSWTLLLFPQEKLERSKTGMSDDTIALDGTRLAFLDPIWAQLSKHPAKEPLVPMEYPQFLALFRRASRAIGVELVPYLCRHSGASLDRASRLRSQEEVQKRGRWASMASVRRYEKHGRLNDTWRTLTEEQQRRFELCEANLARGILFGESCTTAARRSKRVGNC